MSAAEVLAPEILAHVRVIDGTGHAAVDDRKVVVDHGKITAIERAPPPPTPRCSIYTAAR